MEQARYWTWTRRKLSERSHVQASATYNDMWEEKAFAEDSSGPLGGCIWPPRSYSCTFCRREFRSAQALGGHMNVHRRDRARLKQSPSPNNEIIQDHDNPLAYNAYKPKPKPKPKPIVTVISPLSPSSVSVPSTQENYNEHTLVSPSYSSTMVQEQQKKSLSLVPPSSQLDSIAVRVLTDAFDSKLEGEKNLKAHDGGIGGKVDYYKLDSSVSLNLVMSINMPMESADNDESICRKRRRIDATCLNLFPKPSIVDRHHLQSEVLGLGPSSLEDLDLELRLGDRPKVK